MAQEPLSRGFYSAGRSSYNGPPEASGDPANLPADGETADDPSASGHAPGHSFQATSRNPDFYAPRPPLKRGFGDYLQPPKPANRLTPLQPFEVSPPSPSIPSPSQPPSTLDRTAQTTARSQPSRRGFWQRPQTTVERTPPTQAPSSQSPYGSGFGFPEQPPLPPLALRIWERQPYSLVLHLAALLGTAIAAWFLGILIARLFPGQIATPPLQESVLRKTSRLRSRLWPTSNLWQSPTRQLRIEAMPLPETGPILAPLALSPLEKQPLLDELSAIEVEALSLERRLQALEQKLGRPAYQDADINHRLQGLRSAVDPPVRPQTQPDNYKPTPQSPDAHLLEVARLHMSLPGDALFMPGQADIKGDIPLLHQVLDELINYPQATVLVISHSDDQANPDDSREYTLAQAQALSQYLQAALPKGYRWVNLGAGSSQPIADNQDESGRQRNRRIDILVDTR